MPPVVIAIITGIEAALKLANSEQFQAVMQSAREWVAGLFGAGVITRETQYRINSHIDLIAADTLAGIEPSWWKVEPDPVD